MGLWQWIGIALLVWWLWDLYTGETYIIYEPIKRSQQPFSYWFIMLVWGAIASVLSLGIWQ